MTTLPQTEAISNLKNSYDQVIQRLLGGPIFLMQRSKPAAVLVSVDQWQRSATRLAELEERELIRQRQAAAHANPTADIELDVFLHGLDTTYAA